MSNRANPENRNVLHRLRFIELRAWWVGTVQRGMIQEKFGISIAQASGDIQAYLEKNPGSLIYDKNRKYYAAAPTMKMVLGQPLFEEALDLFFGGESLLYSSPSIPSRSLSSGVDSLLLPTRTAQPDVLQAIFRATYLRKAVQIHYFSLNRGEAIWRKIEPHAFGFDGQRWHVRAYCQERKDFRDFVLGRIEKIEPQEDPIQPTAKDNDWETYETVFLSPADELNAAQRKAIEMDYHLENGFLCIKVRKAMKHYLLRSLRIEIPDQTLIPYLKLSEPPEATPLEQAIIPSSTGAWERGSSYVSDKLAIGGIVLVLTTLPQLPYLDEEILNALTLLTLCTLPEEVTPKIDYRIDEGIVWSERIRESITTAKNNGMIESMDQIKITEIGLFTIQNMLGANGALKEHLLKSAINLMETARNKPHILLQAAVAFAMSSPAPNPEAQAILDYLSPQIQNRNFTCIR